ncbi:hypothetical protein [Pseudomonas sp. NPDC086278]|uniref:hypothetical protein n=1 Tax=Pseudomonas sp. NPDC086278 TaxID=3390646 RepID=UPI003CFE7AD2
MSTLSEESRQIVASLAHRVGPNADIATIAQAIASIWQGMDAALTPIIGQQGVAALYRRSLHLCAANHPSLAGTYDSVQVALDLNTLKSVLVEQS